MGLSHFFRNDKNGLTALMPMVRSFFAFRRIFYSKNRGSKNKPDDTCNAYLS